MGPLAFRAVCTARRLLRRVARVFRPAGALARLVRVALRRVDVRAPLKPPAAAAGPPRTMVGAADDDRLMRRLAKYGVHESALTRLTLETLRPGDVAVDVGAHIGYFTLLAARAVGPRGRVVAVEPEPRNFRALLRNLRRARVGNVLAVRAAASDRRGETWLRLSEEHPGDHRIAAVAEGVRIRVAATTLDALLGRARAAFVKIDVQGAEPLVLAGMRKTLAACPDVLVACEYWRPGYARFGFDADRFLALLDELRLFPRLLRRDGDEVPLDPAALAGDSILTLLLRRSRSG